MQGDVNIVPIAALLADTTRANILFQLSDGRALTAGELARRIRVASSTMSAHLARLVEANWLRVETQGRHRYFSLADPAIVQALETLAVFAPPAAICSLRAAEEAKAVRQARTCYNHLAGTFGVALTDALLTKKILTASDEGYFVTEAGECWLDQFGLTPMLKKTHERLYAPHHIDWSERRHHLAGRLGAVLAQRLFDLDWIRRAPASRAVHITEQGKQEIVREFGLRL